MHGVKNLLKLTLREFDCRLALLLLGELLQLIYKSYEELAHATFRLIPLSSRSLT